MRTAVWKVMLFIWTILLLLLHHYLLDDTFDNQYGKKILIILSLSIFICSMKNNIALQWARTVEQDDKTISSYSHRENKIKVVAK